MRGLEAGRLFRVLPFRKCTFHLQTSINYPGFEPWPCGTAVSFINHYNGWVLKSRKKSRDREDGKGRLIECLFTLTLNQHDGKRRRTL
ncbi:hypothetical protein TNCV_15461 [Trichonephila clavipes]|nr:hypothetical protein TNCV_15461 [Trichonephila clavipes]